MKFLTIVVFVLFKAFSFAQAPNYNWVSNNNTSGQEDSYSIAIDSVNKVIYSCGYIDQNGAFPGLLSSEMNYGGGNGSSDGYLAKYDFNGNLIWVVNMGSTGNDEVRAVSLGIDGNVYLTGFGQQSGLWFKSIGTPNYTLASNSNNSDVFIASYTSNGSVRWVRRGGGIGNDYAQTITTTKNSVVVMGTYKDAATFGSFSTTNLYNTFHNHFIVSYNFSGTPLWLAEAKSNGDDGISSSFIYQHSKIIEVNDTLYLVGEKGGNNMSFINSNGTTFGTVLNSSGSISNIFYSALSVNGFWIWSQQIDAGNENPQRGFGIAADCEGLYISGSVHTDVNFPSGYTLNSPEHDVAFMARCSHATGNDTWVNYWTSSSKVNHEDIAQCVFADNKGYVYVTGNYRSDNFFAPAGNLGLAAGTEMFLAKYQNNGTFLWVQSIVGSDHNYIHDLKCTDNKVILTGQYVSDITIPGLGQITGSANENIYLTLGNLNQDPALCNCCTIPPTQALTSPDQSLCATNTTVIYANTPINGIGNWYKVEGGNSTGSGILTNSAVPINTLSGLTYGNNIFTWVISNNFCNPSIDTINIYNYAIPSIANAGVDQTICATSTTLAANVPTAGIGTWSVLSGSATIVSPNSPTSSLIAIGVGTNVLEWTITNGVCASSSSTMMIIRDDFPTISVAGPDQTICATTATMAGNTPIVGVGTWSVLAGAANIISPNSPSTELTSIAVGTNVLEWTISNGVCSPPSASTLMVIRDDFPTISVAGTDQTICATTYTMAGNIPMVGIGTWSLLSGGGNIVSPNSGTSVVNSISVGANVFEWTITNGVCPSSTSTVALTRDDFPTTALAGPDQTICVTSTSVQANTPLVGIGAWSLNSGTFNIVTPNQTTTDLTSIAVGTNIVQWTISNGVCPPSVSMVIVQRDDFPSLSVAGPSMQICSTSTVMAGNTPTVGVGTWSVLSGSANIVSPNSPTTQLTSIGVGTNVLEWSISNGVCSPPNVSTVMIVRDPLPIVAVAGPDQTICATSATMAANNPSVGVGSWSLVSGTVTIANILDPNTELTSIAIGTNVLQWSISFGVCDPSTSTVMVIRDDNPTLADAGLSQLICSTSTVLSGNTPTVGIGTWSVISGAANIVSPNTPTSNLNSIAVGTNVLEWTIANGVCPSSSSTVEIVRDDFPTTAIAGPDQLICSSNATMAANIPTVGMGTWSVLSGAAIIGSPNSPNSALTGIGIGTNVLEWSIAWGVCPPSTSTLMITQYDLPSISIAGIDQTVCASSVTMAANDPTIGVGTWSVLSGTGTVISPNSPTTVVSAIAGGTLILEWAISNGVCPPSTSTVMIIRDDYPENAIAGIDQRICTNTVLLSGNTPTAGFGSWTVISGSAVITNSNLSNSSLTSIAIGTNILQWSINYGVCPPTTSTVMVIRDGLPTISSAGLDRTLCGTNFTFEANNATVGSGTWQSVGSSPSPVNLINPQSPISFTNQGSFEYIWKIENGVCPPSQDTVKITVYFQPSTPSAGSDQEICGLTTTLSANQITLGTSFWQSVDPGVSITNISSHQSAVNFTTQGIWKLIWKSYNGNCPVLADTVLITNYLNPSFADAGIDILSDDNSTQLNAQTPLIGSGQWILLSPDCDVSNSLDPKAIFNAGSEGVYELKWTVSNGVCQETSDLVMVEIRTSIFPEVITPNGDGNNDYLEFKGLKKTQDIKLTIYNRWGSVVFTSNNYKHDFNGVSQDGEVLADDSYFYILEYTGIKINKNLVIKTKP